MGVAILLWLGLSIGSFLNVVIYRLPVMLNREWLAQANAFINENTGAETDNTSGEATPEPTFNLMVPRSRCPHCNHQITALENIPVVSWIVLGAKCSQCHSPISARYPGIEILTGMATLAVVALFGFTPLAVAACLFTWLLIAAIFIDYDTQLLPDQITYPLLWLGLLTNTFTAGIVPLSDAVVGAAAGYLFLWSTYWIFKLLTGKEGMGYGDFKLLAALGAWMGWQALPSIILLSAVAGLLYAVARIVSRRQSRADTIPFGPFLGTAGWFALMFRNEILSLFQLT